MHRSILQALIVAVALLLAVSGVVLAGDDPDSHIETIDEGTELTANESIDEFAEEGYVAADVDGLNMTVHVAEDQRDVGQDSWTSGPHTYLRVQYNESITRTVRFYVPAEYVTPRPQQGVSAEDSDETATYEAVDGGDTMAVTLTLDGETDAVFPVNRWMGLYIDTSDRVYSTIENATNVTLPRLGIGGGEQWEYVPREGLSGSNDTYDGLPVDSMAEAEDMSLQYDAASNATEATWRSVERCSVDTDPVCLTDRDGEPVLFGSTADPPPIRYKTETSLRTEIEAGINELTDEWRDLLDSLTGGL